MISIIKGTVQSCSEKEIIIMTGGIGFDVNVPSSVVNSALPGNSICLFVNLIVREDSLTLYGFNTSEERDIFQMLLGVNGVGPRAALSITDSLNIETIRNAVLNEHIETFSRVPGIGKKTAQKILIHLQGKFEGEPTYKTSSSMDTDSMVVEALTNLGYSVVEAQAAIQSISSEIEDDVSVKLKEALRFFSE